MSGTAATGDWRSWDFGGSGLWPALWPSVNYRQTSASMIEARLDMPDVAGNRLGHVHGGFLASLGEHLLGVFMEARGAGDKCVTVSLSFDYPAPLQRQLPLEARIELVRETGRMQFVRVELAQGAAIGLHGIGTVRKLV